MSPQAGLQEAVQALRSTRLFNTLDPAAILDLAVVSKQRVYGRGQYLWYQGDAGDHLAIICSGWVKVVLTSEQGSEIVLATLGPYESLGELAILDNSPRSASVVAVERTHVLMLPRPALLESMGAHPPVLEAVLGSLGQLVRRLTEQAGDLVFLDLGGRIAKLLLHLAEQHSPDDVQPVVLHVGLSQSDIAAMVGATRPAVNRILQLFASRGLISMNGRAIVLRDLPALRRRAGL
jgi:CRP/FNR family cyclic AMP-dependent transcriptional regulator